MLIFPFIIFLSSLLILQSITIIYEDCPKYSCSDLDYNICSITHKETSFIELQECPHNSYCSFEPQRDKNQCILSSYEYNKKAFPGGKCLSDTDCLTIKCSLSDNTCQSPSYPSCSDSTQCPFGSYCDYKKDSTEGECLLALELHSICQKDEECEWPLGCYDNTCTPFFSIENGAKVKPDTNPLFCKSGLIYDSKCNSVHSIDDRLCSNEDSSCSYMDINGNTITMKNRCRCTISPKPSMKCKWGDIDNPYWKTVLQLYTASLSNGYKTKCNAQEKRPGYCREALRLDWALRSKAIQLEKSLILFNDGDRLINDNDNEALPCGLKSILQFDDTPPLPKGDLFQCPIYKCESVKEDDDDDKTCAYSINPFNENGTGIKVSLKNICPEGYKCNFNPSDSLKNWTINSTCDEIPTSKSWSYKYPGEDCISHSQCLKGSSDFYKDIGFCIEGKCSGHKENSQCKHHSDCLKGLFCNGLYCQEQKGEQHYCLESFECLNYLGCLNNTCVRYYSLSNGTYLNQSNPEPILCKRGEINQETNQCAELDYYGITASQIDKDGFVECSIGQDCHYSTGFYHKGQPVITKIKCTCGYSKEGKAYCPIPTSINKKYWKKLFELTNKQYDNNCHTLRRSKCLDEITFKSQDDFNWYKRNTIKAHLFYNSENCIIEVVKASTISLNLFTLLLITIHLLPLYN